MNEGHKKFQIEDFFASRPKEQLGSDREVYRSNVPRSVESGTSYIVKRRQSEAELHILRHLSHTGHTEKLHTWDDQQLVLKDSEGVYLPDYISEFVNNHPDKIEEEYGPSGSGRFQIKSETLVHLPETSVLSDPEVTNFVSEYVAKLLFLLLQGIFHNDIKLNNFIVEPDGNVLFIDFGKAQLVTDSDNLVSVGYNYYLNLRAGLQLLPKVYPGVNDVVKHIDADLFMGEMPSFTKQLYESYMSEGSSLDQIAARLLEAVSSNNEEIFVAGVVADLEFVGLPKQLAVEIADKLVNMLRKAFG